MREGVFAVRRTLTLMAGLVLLAAGCGSETRADPADAQADAATPTDPAEPTEQAEPASDDTDSVQLTMASTIEWLDRFFPAVYEFVEQVDVVSDGALGVTNEWRYTTGQPDAEQRLVEAVAAGEVELGWVPTRVLDTLGVTNFQALHAPMLVDSPELQAAILDGGIAADMLAGLEEIGVSPLGLIAGGPRLPFSVEAPLLGPDDYDGITFQSYRSDLQFAAITALGATPTDVAGDERDEGLISGSIHGYEYQVPFGIIRSTFSFAPYVTSNVVLWPETVVLIANPDWLAGLDETESTWLHEAAATTVVRSPELVALTAEMLREACDMGARFGEASEVELAALREGFEPVYTQLAEDDDTAEFIAEIDTLKESVAAEPLAIPDGCAAS